MTSEKITRHWLESRLERGWLLTRLICEHPTACTHTSKDSETCAVVDFHDNGGLEDLVPSTAKATFGRVEVDIEWEGWDDEAYPEITPIPPAPAVTRDELADAAAAALRDFKLRLGPNASSLLVAGQWQTFPLTGAEMRDIAAHVIDALIAAGHLRPTEGSDTNHG